MMKIPRFATIAQVLRGTSTSTIVTPAGLTAALETVGLPDSEGVVDATNGGANDLTAIDFIGLAAGAKRITVMLSGLGLTADFDVLIQIGDSGGLETSGYASGMMNTNGTNFNHRSSASGFITYVEDPTDVILTLQRVSGNSWVCSHAGDATNGWTETGGGSKTLTAELDRLRVAPKTATTFNNGSVNVLVET